MPYGTVNADVIGTSVAGANLGAGNASLMKNRIINGAMVIDQRNAGASLTPTSGQYLVDRFKCALSQASKFTAQQNQGSVTPPAGFTNYLGMTVASAVSIGSTDYFLIQQLIEGYNMADLGWGTANAKTVTLSFWVRSSLTGTFGISLTNSNFDYSYPATYTISSANTWEQKSITITGPTSGTWLITNGCGFQICFGLGVGSTYSGTPGSWSANGYSGATGATSVVGTSGATFYITGVQLEVGSSATGFEYRQYQQELALCQRYYETAGFGLLGIGNSSTGIWGQIIYKVQKRATPTIGLYTTTQTWSQFGTADRTSSSVSIGDSARSNTWGSITRIEGFSSVGTNAPLGCNTDTVFTLSAEL